MSLNIVTLISGNGSNLQALINAAQKNHLPIKLKAVISSNPEAYGLLRAAKANIPTETVLPKEHKNRPAYDLALVKKIAQYQPDLIILAGFMRILGDHFLDVFENKIINIHPSLLPKYPGLDTHQQAIAQGDAEHGCSIHIVTRNLDAGPIIAQATVKVASEDTAESLQQKVHKAEHFLYPTVVNWFAAHRITIKNDRVFIDNVAIPVNGLQFAFN